MFNWIGKNIHHLETKFTGDVVFEGKTTHTSGDDIKLTSSANLADYCTLAVTTNGATTLTTVDGDAALANFEIAADGDITLDAAGAINLEPGTGAILLNGITSYKGGVFSTVAAAHNVAGTNISFSAGATTAGTTNNIAGGHLTFQGGQGKGSGAGGDIVFRTANAGGSGSAINALATALTISDDLSATFAGSVSIDSVGVSAVQTSAESFVDNDTSLMTSAAIADKIEAYSYATAGDNTTITTLTNASLILARDADNNIDFTTDNTIKFKVGGDQQVLLEDGVFKPHTDGDVNLGHADYRFGEIHGENIYGVLTGNVTGNTSGTAATVTGGTQAAITSCANLVTVGTIGTGVWQGTAVASAYMVSGTDSAKGALELATTAEAITGTDTARAVTPAGLKARVSQIVNLKGYAVLQDGVYDYANPYNTDDEAPFQLDVSYGSGTIDSSTEVNQSTMFRSGGFHVPFACSVAIIQTQITCNNAGNVSIALVEYRPSDASGDQQDYPRTVYETVVNASDDNNNKVDTVTVDTGDLDNTAIPAGSHLMMMVKGDGTSAGGTTII